MSSSIDATGTCNQSCHLVNDANEKSANSKMRLIEVKGQPRLCLFAKQDFGIGEEITYDYGAENLWWRENVS